MTAKNSVLCIVIFLSVLSYMYGSLQESKKEIKRLNAQIVNIKAEAERLKENEVQICNSRTETAEAVKKDKSGFNWNFNYYSADPIVRLRQKCRSCTGTAD